MKKFNKINKALLGISLAGILLLGLSLAEIMHKDPTSSQKNEVDSNQTKSEAESIQPKKNSLNNHKGIKWPAMEGKHAVVTPMDHTGKARLIPKDLKNDREHLHAQFKVSGPQKALSKNFNSYDLNADGKISQEEMVKVLDKQRKTLPSHTKLEHDMNFSSLDTNGDGNVSREEFARHQPQKPFTPPRSGFFLQQRVRALSFNDFDMNGDGQIAEDELYRVRARLIMEQPRYPSRALKNLPKFSDIDTNGDGSISKEEFNAADRVPQGLR